VTITAHSKTRHYKDQKIWINAATRQSLVDWKTLLPTILQDPMPCTNLVPAVADFGGYCDASKEGAGRALLLLVWWVAFPPNIQREVVQGKSS